MSLLSTVSPTPFLVIPAKAAIQSGYVLSLQLDSRFRGNDGRGERGW
ncbi:MAG: hypothetical protein KA533_02760 [Sphingobium sp.]|nr:hypothetical protein [Sphingobium sp.]MBP6112024.1 hypothetical protein [Sphingobium sp.]MBP8669842.1 hypothetical protein [Sphingobium sp.]MBP9156398.1 hypothetical protein [Sphingobium sp.]